MNARERFLALMEFEPVDRTLKWEFGYWSGAVRRWYAEGLPCRAGVPAENRDGEGIRGEGLAWDHEGRYAEDLHDFFGMDPALRRIPLEVYVCPRFEEKVLEDHDDWRVVVDELGVTKKERKDRTTLPQVVNWPVSSREDWDRLKAERLRPTLDGRLPADWPQIREELRQRDYPLAIGGGTGVGFFGVLRYLMGPENLLMAYVDQPDLVRDVAAYLADFWVAIFDQVLDQVDADLALLWEDMCYKTGPLISPAMFREFMLPCYQKVTSFLRDRGVRIVHVDTDGNCWSLIPLFVEGGVTGLYPWEVNAGMDVVEVRKAFPRLQMLGGIDKVQIAAGPAAIDAELGYRVPPLLRSGGFVPYVDHLVPPDTSWADFSYYREKLSEMLERAGKGRQHS